MLQNELTNFYLELNKNEPNIIRGAMNADFDEVKAALENNPTCITEADENTGLTALHIAAGECNLAMVDLLCSYPGFDLTLQDAWGRQPYLLAISMGREDIAERMVHAFEAHQRSRQEKQPNPGVLSFRPKGSFGPQ